MDPRLEGRLSTILLVGFGFVTAGIAAIILSFVLPLPGLPMVGGPAFIIGLIIVGYAFASGTISMRGGLKPNSFPVQIDTCRVVARFAMDELNQMLFQDLEGRDNLRYFVRLWFPNGTQNEYRCGPDVFGQCGEGMWGSATVQGDWLGGFVPKAPPPSSGAPYL